MVLGRAQELDDGQWQAEQMDRVGQDREGDGERDEESSELHREQVNGSSSGDC